MHQLPSWCGPDGLPRSWRHYQHGLAYLGRAHIRQLLLHAEAARLAGAVAEDYQVWHRDTAATVGPGR